MVEHGDTRAEELLNAFGTRFNPLKEYTMRVMDRTELAELGDIQSIIPTFESLTSLIRLNPGVGITAEVAKLVLNEAFSQ